MIVAPFHPGHLSELRTQSRQKEDMGLFAQPEYGPALAEGQAFTVFDAEGVIRACMGVHDLWPGRGLCWALLAPDLRRLMLPISVRARAFFDACGYRRLEAYVDPGFAEAIRWVELLGFEREGLQKQFTPDGADMYLYARIR
jgi:hypothetical protein